MSDRSEESAKEREAKGVTQASTIEEKLFTIGFDHAPETHIACIGDDRDWDDKRFAALQWACPAKVYEKGEDGALAIGWENCIECGTCQILAPDHILWVYPKGGFGIRNAHG